VTGSPAFAKLILSGDYETALSVARQQVEGGAQIIDVNMDEGMLDSKAAMEKFLRLVASEPDICKVPIMVDSSKWEVLETGLKNIQGKAIVNSISLKEGEQKFIEHAALVRCYGAAVIIMAFDEKGQADTLERRKEICARSYKILTEQVGFPSQDIIFDPNVLTVATGLKNTIIMLWISSKRRGGSNRTYLVRKSAAGSVTSPFHSAATTSFEKRCMPPFSITRLKLDSIWAS